MGFRKPDDTVYTSITLKRWQKEWTSDHKTINFSGFVQEKLLELIKEKDPKYHNLYVRQMILKEIEKTPTKKTKEKIKVFGSQENIQ